MRRDIRRAGIFLLILLTSCIEQLPSPPEVQPAVPASSTLLLVLNTLSREVSALDLTGDSLLPPPFLRAGRWTNRIHTQGGYLWIVNSGENNIYWMDLNTGSLDTLHVGSGRNPWDARWSERLRRLFVTNWLTHTLSALDPFRDSVLWEVSVCANPEGLVVVYSRVVVACTDYIHGYAHSGIRVVDGHHGTLLDSLSLGANLQEVILDREGDLYALSTGDYATTPGKLYRLRLDPLRVVDSLMLGGFPGSLFLSPEGVLVIGGFQGGVFRYDAEAETLRTHLSLDDVADVLEWKGKLYLARFSLDVVEVRDTLGNLLQRWSVGDGPLDLEILPPAMISPLNKTESALSPSIDGLAASPYD